MNSKLVEINLRAQESLATVGNYEKELEELMSSDITQEQIKKYRQQTPDLAYVFSKLEKDKQVLNILGKQGMQLMQRKKEGLIYSEVYEDMLDDFVKWKPDYSDYAYDYEDKTCKIDYSFKKDGDISALGRLQGPRVSQMRLLKKIMDVRKKNTQFYYKDINAVVENCNDYDLPYFKYQTIIEMANRSGLINGYVETEDEIMDEEVMENGLIKEVDFTFKYKEKPYGFTPCLEKSKIASKRWTRVLNGQKALKNDIYLALVISFYLGIDTLEDVETFLNCFGISLNSPCELVNTVPISEVKKAIKAGIHYDNIIYYLRMSKEII